LGAILIITSIDATGHGVWWRNLLERPILVQVGKWSYSMYLFQQMFLVPKTLISEKWQTAPLNLITCFLLVPVIYYLWEVPLRNIGKKLAKGI
jgi:peptidoglycan/LPS O-acetylase OafA/YrhL